MANQASFSNRQGYVRPQEIVFRGELSDELRQPIIEILRHSSTTPFLRQRIDRLFNPYGIDELPRHISGIFVSAEEHKDPDFIEIKRVLLGCEWFRLYDLIEDIFQQLHFYDSELRADPEEDLQAYPFQSKINDYFVHAGIGWQLVDGKVIARGDAALEHVCRNRVEGRRQDPRPQSALRTLSEISPSAPRRAWVPRLAGR
jgi:hypothetical protein